MKKKIFWGVAGVFILVFTILWLNRLTGVMRGGSESAVVEHEQGEFSGRKGSEGTQLLSSSKALSKSCSSEPSLVGYRQSQDILSKSSVSGGSTTYTAENEKSVKASESSHSPDEKKLSIQRECPAPIPKGKGGIIGRVIDGDTGEGISGVNVGITKVGMHPGRTRYGIKPTDEEGYYRIDELPPGRYKISCHINDIKFKGTFYIEYRRAYIEVEVPEDERMVQAPDIALKKGGIVKVRVLNADGEMFEGGLESAEVIVPGYYEDGEDWRGYTRGLVKAISEPDGSYLISGVPETEDGELRVWAFGYGMVEKKGIKVRKGEVAEVDVVIPTDDPTGIKGVIRDAETGEPIEGAAVNLAHLDYSDAGYALTNEKGEFQILGVPPGKYIFYTYHVKYTGVEKSKPIEIEKGVTKTLSLSLFPEGAGKGDFIKVKDPKANVDQKSCGNLKPSIEKAFNSAMSTFQTCLPDIWNGSLSGIDKINIVCDSSCGAGTSGYYDIDGKYIGLCITSTNTLVSDNPVRTLFHETLHFLDYDENNAYTCSYKCKLGGCVTCERPSIGECDIQLTSSNSCDNWLTGPTCPNPTRSKNFTKKY